MCDAVFGWKRCHCVPPCVYHSIVKFYFIYKSVSVCGRLSVVLLNIISVSYQDVTRFCIESLSSFRLYTKLYTIYDIYVYPLSRFLLFITPHHVCFGDSLCGVSLSLDGVAERVVESQNSLHTYQWKGLCVYILYFVITVHVAEDKMW